MAPIHPLRSVPALALAAAMLFAPACGSATLENGPNYRTIRADPTRNTAAAKRLEADGLAKLEAGDLDGAEAAFREALVADVEYGPAHNNLGKVLFLEGDFYNAAWEFEFAAKLLPRRPEPPNNLGLVLEQAGELDRAVEQYRVAVQKGPQAIEYRANLARALIKRGERTREVSKLLDEVLAEDTRPDWLIWAKTRRDAMRHLFP